MNWVLAVIWDYCLAVLRYWWLVVPGIVMPLLDISKAHIRQFRVPRWLALLIGFTALILAQFVAYKDSIKNLSKVIEEKREAVIDRNSVQVESHAKDLVMAAQKQELIDLKQQPPHL